MTTITHYSHRLTLAAPPLTSAALLASTVRQEAILDVSPVLTSSTLLPDRATANATGHMGITLEDVHEFHYNVRTPFLERCAIDLNANPVDSERGQGSMRHDEDWSRQVSCYDPWMEPPPLRGVVYTPGALSGSWSGRILVCDRRNPVFIRFIIDVYY
jgi:hypothetical protein